MTALAIVLAVLLLLSLAAFVYYCMKGGNLIVGLTIIAFTWFVFGTVWTLSNLGVAGSIHSFQDVWNPIVSNLNIVFSDGPIGYGTTTAIIIFASWFGRVVVDTGIAKALIRKVVELAGNQQIITVLLVSLVSALIFTSIFGPGSVMAMGAIILPILLSIGVKKKIAVGSFLMSVAAGMYVNKGYDSQFSGNAIFAPIWKLKDFNGNFTAWTWASFGVHVVILVLFILFNYYISKDKVKSWAMPADDASDFEVDNSGNNIDEEKPVSNWSFIVPFVPVVMSLITSIPNMFLDDAAQLTSFAAIVGFMVGIIFGLALTGNFKSYKKLVAMAQKTLYNGFTDVALLIGMLLIMNCFSTAAGSKICAPIFQAALNGGMDWVVKMPWLILVIFIVLAPLALFRGPFMVWGSGIAVAAVLGPIILGGGTGIPGKEGYVAIPEAFYTVAPLLLVLFYVQPVGMVADSCPTQSWNMWALSYAKYEPRQLIKNNIGWGWVVTAINMAIGYFLLVA